jgi:hypothetical protein
MHGKRNLLSILLDCMKVVHAGRQKCFWLCREKLVSFVVQTKQFCSESDADCVVRVLRSSIFCCTKQNYFVLNRMQTVLLGFWEVVYFVVQKQNYFVLNRMQTVLLGVLLTSFIWLVGTIHQCCSWKNLPTHPHKTWHIFGYVKHKAIICRLDLLRSCVKEWTGNPRACTPRFL